jgi:hypothetical protein
MQEYGGFALMHIKSELIRSELSSHLERGSPFIEKSYAFPM